MAAAPLAAVAPAASFDRIFSAAGEPAALRYDVMFMGDGRVHRMTVWRDGDRRVKRVTDDALVSVATHRPGDAAYDLTLLDMKRRISTRIGRANLYRVGNFTDWFDLTHGLRHPKGAYRLTPGTSPAGLPKPVAGCRWYDLAQGPRVDHICWDPVARIPLLIATKDGRPVWRVTAMSRAAIAPSTFAIDDRGFIRNDANHDIDPD
ncbi:MULTISPECIES: hypothetical protein [unclassified Sphingomonas]|uniref:hypothetical protein n=1 Tax=unclassified Sphingomonas TaxID=196159 RepID=UPI00226AD63F|nr:MULTISPECIES: hypothetical protein [unclassified Sphingomonas]